MVTTSSKAKIPSGFSYPVGTAQLDAAFGDVPNVENMEVWYSASVSPDVWPYQPINLFTQLKRGGPCPILACRYSVLQIPSAAMVKGTRMTPTWSISVRPVPSPLRSIAKTMLARDAFPILRDWMMTARTPTWLEQSHRLNFSFDWTEQALMLSEEQR
ncbi:MAG: hypothetical protein SGJ19_20205 [Planctomycetia bacterium]|nr:hypothetical protein [Planctomycetia bacterium]